MLANGEGTVDPRDSSPSDGPTFRTSNRRGLADRSSELYLDECVAPPNSRIGVGLVGESIPESCIR